MMRTHIESYSNPQLGMFNEDSRGYAVIQYAANSHLLGVNSALRFSQLTDGTSNTLLGGEVTSRFTA